jgi:hypothetical protein
MPDAPAPDLPRFGRYLLERRIASGGMADVYLAIQTGAFGFTKRVALKVLRQDVAAEGDNVRMFLREALVAAEFHHPNLVQVYEVGEERGKLFLAMELVRGISAASLMLLLARRERSMPIPMAARIALDVLDGLAYAHEARGPDGAPFNVIHRDVTPHNILIAEDGTVKLVDFGIARAETALGKTQVARIKGKFSYMAPEQWDTARTLDGRADLFSLGVSLYEMSTGSGRLFRGSTAVELHHAVNHAPIPPPSSRVPTYPANLGNVVMTALERDLGRRWPSARAMRAALAETIESNHWQVDARALSKLVAYALDGAPIDARWEPVVADADLFGPVAPDGRDAPSDPPPALRPASVAPPPDGPARRSVLRAASVPGLPAVASAVPTAVALPPADAGYTLGPADAPAADAPAVGVDAPSHPARTSPPLRGALFVATLVGWGGAAAATGLWLRATERVSTLQSLLDTPSTATLTPTAPAAGAGALVVLADPTVARAVAAPWAERVARDTDGLTARIEVGDALPRLILGASTVALRVGLADDEAVAQAAAQGIVLRSPAVEHPVGFDHAAVVVHPSNPIASLTVAQLGALFAGRVASWQALRGPRSAPLPIVCGAGGPSRGLLDALVLPAAGRGAAVSSRAVVAADEAAAVALVARSPEAVALVRLAFVRDSVKVLTIGPTPATALRPTREDIRALRYPLARPLVLYTRGGPAGPAEALLRYALSPAGQSVLEQAGYIGR